MDAEKEAEQAFRKALRVGGRGVRTRKLEPLILKSPNWSARYAFYCVGGRWKQAEAVIKQVATAATSYAFNVRGPFPEAEKTIAKDAQQAYFYAKNVLQDRFPIGERVMAMDAEAASRYASDIIKGRWRKGEKAIMTESRWMLHYAKKALKGPLPEPMHTAMVMQTFTDDPYAKKYGSTKKFMNPPTPKTTKKKAKA
jgi:hypothetical protein